MRERRPAGLRKHLRLVKAQARRGDELACECLRESRKKLDEIMRREEFKLACAYAMIPPSRRQALKWSRGQGVAFGIYQKVA